MDLTNEENLDEGQGAEGEAPAAPTPFIGDYDEETTLDILSRAREMPDTITALENRLQGSYGDLSKRFDTYAKGLPTRSSLDVEKLSKVLESYDPKLAEVLGPALQEAFQISPLDENTLRPHLQPMQDQMREWMGQQLVLSVYSPETVAEIVPPVKDGRFAPEGQRHEDFMNWYAKQGYQTQQSLLSFGAPYIQALRKFEAWETKLNEDRAAKAGKQTQRLQNGQMPSSRSRIPPQPSPQSADEAFAAGFDEVFKESKR